MLQRRPRHKRDVTECGSTKGRTNTNAGSRRGLRRAFQVVEIFLRNITELFKVVFRIERILGKRSLPYDAVEEVTAARHPSAGCDGCIAFRIDQCVSVCVDRRIEVFPHQDIEPIELPGLPLIHSESESGISRKYAPYIKPHRIEEIVIDQCKHLKRLVDAHRALFKSVMITKRSDATGVHSGDGGPSEIDRDSIGLFVVQCCGQTIAARKLFNQGAHEAPPLHDASIFTGYMLASVCGGSPMSAELPGFKEESRISLASVRFRIQGEPWL